MSRSFPARWILPAGLAVLQALILAASCAEEPFEPIQASGFDFSVYGFLDASADTQWVRVTSLKTHILPDSALPDATVTLEHLGTGEVIPLHDSLFAYGTALYARNFWTDESMEQGERYRITAARSNGGTSSAEATVPVDADSVIVRVGADGRPSRATAELRIAGVEYVAMVHVIPSCGGTYQFGGPTAQADGNDEIVRTIRRVVICGPPPPDTIRSWDIWLAISGSPWPYDPEWNFITAVLPEVASNIEDGLGFFGGVLTRTVPLELCYIIGANPGDLCELVYTDHPTSVEGTVSRRVGDEDDCRSVPLWKRAVFIWEDDQPEELRVVQVEDIYEEAILLHEPDGVTVRSAYTERDGSFRISALKPGIPYSLAVSYGDEPDYFRAESFVIPAGETLTLDVELPGECS